MVGADEGVTGRGQEIDEPPYGDAVEANVRLDEHPRAAQPASPALRLELISAEGKHMAQLHEG